MEIDPIKLEPTITAEHFKYSSFVTGATFKGKKLRDYFKMKEYALVGANLSFKGSHF